MLENKFAFYPRISIDKEHQLEGRMLIIDSPVGRIPQMQSLKQELLGGPR